MKTKKPAQRSRRTRAAQRGPQKRVVMRLREQLERLAMSAAYVCAHDYESPVVGTRLIAISDLRAEYARTVIVLKETHNH